MTMAMNEACAPALIIIVILSEAKDLLSPAPAKKQNLRFAQDDHFQISARIGLQLLDQSGHPADVLHLLDILGIKLHSELFFNGEHQIQMLHGIPILDRF